MQLLSKDITSIEEVSVLVAKAKHAQELFASFSQEKIDEIVKKVSLSASKEAEKLAKLANEETGFGNWQDKVIKNKFASEVVYEYIKDIKTVGILSDESATKVIEVAVPVGVVAGLIPSTNPTSTVIYKALIALKAGNAIIFSPHPMALKSIIETVNIITEAAIEAGAPEGIIGCIIIPTIEGTNELMKHRDVSLILATGGEAMVKAAYSSGTPAIGVGPGNAPAFIEKSADIKQAVKRIIDSKTFDNGVICASEQSVVVEQISKEEVVQEFKNQGAYFLSNKESEELSHFILRDNGTMNPAIVGKSPQAIADLIGLTIPEGTRILISEQTTVGKWNPYSREKLTPILAFYTEETWETACERCVELLMNEGKGHTFILHSNNEEIIKEFSLKIPVSRIIVNTPGSLGGIGGSTNLIPSLTLGCGAIGGSATSDNVGPLNLINTRRVAYGVRELEDIKG
ncbi:acetaldehyde dehydrogenase (acetylating) [Bacillus atrophaeus]|uniref:acetaldehyde dehydrogenase (acetylating) n=1 Tax=Bacillus atrophaeus TaxID=1452 RepID=UPI00227F41C7|nr:acetaldehyde dehydrogenase (acetylating) [Bacillus atrophaeus]MCY8486359.1 acetaldehyde dehydrogenase (acetylating) [Bacillus atrophaeus]MCY8933959.1 acetaldehyde dehydrogenase (acetylating) [Bacillus atrophaeus]MCY8943796.1 acetaldehyde dehydrogenase (acetylating) [Bacillus atrophaeus]MCY8946723.1 acetaldehyde dehydrogenase (acetylating) [Bacillus atrophaeus]MCY8949626.1 acetaldehyde dehydrogenase (acetylating) [Bacillus atrophaeus]